ncbi:MAG: ankyrin repeat domain-containing protein, partial [Burkholderiales bacterium]
MNRDNKQTYTFRGNLSEYPHRGNFIVDKKTTTWIADFNIDTGEKHKEPPHVDGHIYDRKNNLIEKIKYPLDDNPQWDTMRRQSEAYRKTQEKNNSNASQNFKDSVKTSGLTESYNANHPESQIENPGQKGSPTGGVESYVGIIKGLLNSTAHLFEQEHWFAFKGEDGRPPFTEGELQQIIRELAYAIYVHDTVPFFSLHFNSNGTMYPVIHHAYENTLVGRVISMLDYFMKGYLNGGFFNEENIDNWNEALNYDGLNSKFIAMHQYCVDKLPNSKYISLRHMMDLYHINQYQKELGEAGESIMAKNKFQISFRIIAKQDGIEKVDRLFVFTPAFEVQYTIEIQDSGYQAYIAEHKAKHGEVPAEMKMLEQLCTQVARDIETTMPKLPICRDYFHMLGVINALSYYFKTLKLMKKVPLLPRAEPAKTTCCPSIFPPLPVEHLKAIKIPFDLAKIAAKLNPELKQQLNQAIAKQIGREAINIPGINIPGYLTTDLITAFKAALPLDFLIPADAIILGMIKNIFDLLWDKLKVLKPQLHLAYSRLAEVDLEELTSMQQIKAKEDKALESLEAQRRELLQKMSKSEEENLEEMQNQAKQSYGYRYNYMMENLIKNQAQQHWQKQRSKLEALIQEEKNSEKREAENERNRIKGVGAQLRQVYKAAIDKLVIMINTPLNSKELTEEVSFKLSGRQRIVKVQTEAERINEEQWLTVKIHGGCGLNLSNQVAVATPVAEQLFNISYQNMQDAIQEKWLATTHQNSTYYSFKLPIANFFAADNSDYEWLGNSLIKDVRLTNEADAELQAAISLQDTPQIQQLLKTGKIDTKAYNEEGRTALHLAVLSNDLASVTALIKDGFNVSQGDKDGLTALHLAAQLGYVDIAEKLSQAQATALEMQTKHKATALYLAVQHGQFEVVKLLVGYGANVNTPIHNSLFPLYIAIYNEHYAIASFLLSTSKVDPQAKVTDESTALHLAVQLDLADLVEQMFKLGFNIAAKRRDGMSPLHLAVKNGNLAIATALIDAVKIVTAKDPKRKITHSSLVNQTTNSGLTPLHIACEQGDIAMAELLLKNGANPNLITVDEKNALIHAIEAGQHQLALMMIPLTDLHAVNGDKDTVLMLACQYNLMDLAYLLVETNKFKISQLDSNGWGYIHYLARRSDITHLEILLKKQPRLFTETTQNGLTILDIALMHGHTTLVSELQLQQLIKTVDYFRVLPNGWNYIQLAARHGLIDVV